VSLGRSSPQASKPSTSITVKEHSRRVDGKSAAATIVKRERQSRKRQEVRNKNPTD